MNKLRLTGFECFASFVIHCAMHTPKGCGPPLATRACLGIKKTDEFPNRSVRLISFCYYKDKKQEWNNQIKKQEKLPIPSLFDIKKQDFLMEILYSTIIV